MLTYKVTTGLIAALPALAWAQSVTVAPGPSGAAVDPVAVLVGRLDLESYKATIKGLTQFGDRREGTDRNRAAIDWIEAQLKKYGCTNTERMVYVYNLPPPQTPPTVAAAAPSTIIASGELRAGVGGSRLRGITRPVVPNNNPDAQTDPALRALMRSHRPLVDASRFTARKSGPRAPTRCTSSAPTWMVVASARQQTTMVREPPW